MIYLMVLLHYSKAEDMCPSLMLLRPGISEGRLMEQDRTLMGHSKMMLLDDQRNAVVYLY